LIGRKNFKDRRPAACPKRGKINGFSFSLPRQTLKEECVAQNFIWRRCAVTRYGCAKTFGAQEGTGLSQTFGRFAVNGIFFNHESPRQGKTSRPGKFTGPSPR